MKRILPFLLLLMPLLFLACEDEDSPVVQPVSFGVKVNYSSAYGNQVASNVKVKVLNLNSKIATEMTTNEVGVANFENLPVGVYDISVSQAYTPAQFLEFAGQAVENDVVFNATITNQTINAAASKLFELELASSPVGSLVIKQVYYAGSHAKDGALYRDQFIEIYNNADQVQYADGLCFGQVVGKGGTVKVDPMYLQESGQYNWSKSVGMTAGAKANTDFIYMESLYQIPGTGTQFPIQPGQSIVIAQNAINHKAPYQDQSGKTITPINPELTVNLSGADFETFYGTNFASDIDNPAVPNVKLLHTVGRDMILDTYGRDAYAIFRLKEDIASVARYPKPGDTEITSSTTLHYQIPLEWVLDAVEAQQSPVKLLPKRLPGSIDAGYTYNPMGIYSSQSVVRKIAKTFNGRNILQDTNNSTNDFKVLDRSNPRGF